MCLSFLAFFICSNINTPILKNLGHVSLLYVLPLLTQSFIFTLSKDKINNFVFIELIQSISFIITGVAFILLNSLISYPNMKSTGMALIVASNIWLLLSIDSARMDATKKSISKTLSLEINELKKIIKEKTAED